MSEVEKEEVSKIQNAAVEVVKYLQSQFPDSNLVRISVLMDLLEIEFKALSFIKIPAESLNSIGHHLIDNLYETLTKLWEGDKKHRKVKKVKDA